jgi:hypothetical protein
MFILVNTRPKRVLNSPKAMKLVMNPLNIKYDTIIKVENLLNEGLAEFELLKAYINNAECDMIYVETPYVECEYVE